MSVKKENTDMNTQMIVEIEQRMQNLLDNKQMEQLHIVLESVFLANADENDEAETEKALVEAFLSAKKLEGCSVKSLR